jgi:hypothetical protein
MVVRQVTPAVSGPIPLALNWEALEVAVERNSPDTDSYLDLVTGEIVSITIGEPEAEATRVQLSDNIKNYLRIEPASSKEQYRWMEKFVGSVEEPSLRERLMMSIDGKGAFRRFKDVLLAYPKERERWFAYRAELLHWHIQTWLETHDIVATNEPPWGKIVAPAELPVVGPPIVHGTDAPGEVLRRQARELIDVIPAIDLPTAIAFLEFLRHRSNDASAASADLRDGRDLGTKLP